MRAVCFALAAVLLLTISPPAVAASCTGSGFASIAGRITRPSGVGVTGVTVNLAGPGGCTNSTTSKERGVYIFVPLRKGTYTVTPAKTGCTFTPPSRVVTVPTNSANVAANFQAVCAPGYPERRPRDTAAKIPVGVVYWR